MTIYRPQSEPQEMYFACHRHYHAIHAQVNVDNTGHIHCFGSEYPGHQNDSQQYAHLPLISRTNLSFFLDTKLLLPYCYAFYKVTIYSTKPIKSTKVQKSRHGLCQHMTHGKIYWHIESL